MHADEPVTQPARRAGELAAAVVAMVLVAAVVAAVGFGLLWLVVELLTGFVDSIDN